MAQDVTTERTCEGFNCTNAVGGYAHSLRFCSPYCEVRWEDMWDDAREAQWDAEREAHDDYEYEDDW